MVNLKEAIIQSINNTFNTELSNVFNNIKNLESFKEIFPKFFDKINSVYSEIDIDLSRGSNWISFSEEMKNISIIYGIDKFHYEVRSIIDNDNKLSFLKFTGNKFNCLTNLKKSIDMKQKSFKITDQLAKSLSDAFDNIAKKSKNLIIE